MKIPKKLTLFGYQWRVRVNPKDEGGSFSWNKKLITVGAKLGEQEEIFIHELMEAILVHQLNRYYGNEQAQEYTFHLTHSDFVRFHRALFQALKDNKLI